MRLAFSLIFAASGAAALVYEVTWTRLLTLQLGHGVAAASTVLAAFMGGLAAGSAIGGRVGSRVAPRQALRVYAALELGIGVLALILPFELRALNPLFTWVTPTGLRARRSRFLRLGASLVLLSLPAAAMGATFPIASRWFVQHAAHAARDAGALYSANTIGAAAGALLAGFVLLPQLGLSGTTWVGVALNAAAASGAWWMARAADLTSSLDERPETTPARASKERTRSRRAKSGRSSERSSKPHQRASFRRFGAASPSNRWQAAAALGISGFASLTLQVVWTRLLALVLGPTTYAFSTMVGIFIAGIAIGAAIGSRLAARTRQPVVGLALCLSMSAACAALSAALVDRALLSLAAFVAQPGVTFEQVLMRQAIVAVGLVAPMTIAFGVAFPFAAALATRSDESVSADLGVIYAVNTAGAIAGALLTGFVFISWLGLHGTIRAVTIVSALGALLVLWVGRARPSARAAGVAIAIAVLALGVWLPPWDRLLLSSGAYKYAASLRGPDLATALRAGSLLYYREGPSGTVAVRRLTGSTSLAIDGKVDASNSGDMLTQRLLAHVPLLLHPNPEACCDPGARKRRHLGIGADASDRTGRRARDFAGSRRSLAFLRRRESRGDARCTNTPDRRRRPIALAADAAPVRRDRLGAVEPVDGRHRLALHAGIFRSRARPTVTRRRAVPMGAHLRHQHAPTCSRSSPPSSRSFQTARSGWLATAMCC